MLSNASNYSIQSRNNTGVSFVVAQIVTVGVIKRHVLRYTGEER